jgi:hypothetical protein
MMRASAAFGLLDPRISRVAMNDCIGPLPQLLCPVAACFCTDPHK